MNLIRNFVCRVFLGISFEDLEALKKENYRQSCLLLHARKKMGVFPWLDVLEAFEAKENPLIKE